MYDCPTKFDETFENIEDYGINDNCIFQENSLGFAQSIHLYSKDSCISTSCEEGLYKCYRQNYCISIELICNGLNECFFGDDEVDCS